MLCVATGEGKDACRGDSGGPLLEPGMLCVATGEGKAACRGDSGGPLTTVVNGQHVLIGDVSNGLACKGPCSIFGDVAHYRKWIDQTVAANGGGVSCAA